ncbi:unnamed protein product, partial [Laminaria digitata]
NVEGSKKAHALYCKKHARAGMVDIVSKRCKQDSCTTIPSFNFNGSKTPVYCKQHLKAGMVGVHRKRCSKKPCTELPAGGVPADGGTTACIRHKSDVHLINGLGVNIRAPC